MDINASLTKPRFATLEDIISHVAEEHLGKPWFMPLAPKSTHPRGFAAMTVEDASNVIASYNEYIRQRHAHQRDSLLPPDPEWDYAARSFWIDGPQSGFMFKVRETGRVGVMRIAGLKGVYHKQLIKFECVLWAGWEHQA